MPTTGIELAPEIEDIENFHESMNFLIYGDSGHGKTTFCSQLPNVLLVASEQGAGSARRAGVKCKIWVVRSFAEMEKVYDYFRTADHPFEWALVDSLTDLQLKLTREIVKKRFKEKPRSDPHAPELQEYFRRQLMLQEMVTDWNDLPVNVCWTAQSMRKTDAEGEDIVIPLIEGKEFQISSWVCASVDLLGHLAVKANGEGKFEHVLTVQPSPPIWAKNRYDLPRSIRNPDIRAILKRIKETEDPQPNSAPKAETTQSRTPARRRRPTRGTSTK